MAAKRFHSRFLGFFSLFVGLQTAILLSVLVLIPGMPHSVPESHGPMRTVQSSPFRHMTYEVEAGATLQKVWAAAGAGAEGAAKASAAAQRKGVLQEILEPGKQLDLIIHENGEIGELFYNQPSGETYSLSGSTLLGYELITLPADVREETREASGLIENSFDEAAKGNLIPRQIVDDFVDLFGNSIEFSSSLRSGAGYTLRYVERISRRTGVVLTPGPILSASLYVEGRLLARFRRENENGEVRYYDESGQPVLNSFLRYPLKFSRISSSFSWGRFHPQWRKSRPHLGIDFAAALHTPVRAVADGVVADAGLRGTAGNMVRIKHSERFSSEYLHLADIAPGLSAGARVSRGQIIGSVGSTGVSTGPHLHFALFDGERYVDPLRSSPPDLGGDSTPLDKDILAPLLHEARTKQLALNFVQWLSFRAPV